MKTKKIYPLVLSEYINGYSIIKEKFILVFICILSQVYKLPSFIYSPVEKINSFIVYKIWRGQIYWFQLKQLGIMEFGKKFISKVKRKLIKVYDAN